MVSIQFIRENRRTILLILLMGILATIISSALTFYSIRYETLIRNFGWTEWIVFYICVCFTMAFALTPTTFIALFSGYFLGWSSLLLMSISYMAASYISYQAGTFLDKGKFMRTVERYPGVNELITRLKTGQWGMIILCRLSPVLPFAIMNILFSMLKVDMRKYIWGSFVGMLPRTIIAIAAGTQAQTIRLLWENGESTNLVRVGFSVLLIISVVGIVYYVKRILQKQVK